MLLKLKCSIGGSRTIFFSDIFFVIEKLVEWELCILIKGFRCWGPDQIVLKPSSFVFSYNETIFGIILDFLKRVKWGKKDSKIFSSKTAEKTKKAITFCTPNRFL